MTSIVSLLTTVIQLKCLTRPIEIIQQQKNSVQRTHTHFLSVTHLQPLTLNPLSAHTAQQCTIHLLINKDIKAKLPVHSETAPNIKNHCSSYNTKLNIPHFSIIIINISHKNLYICRYTGFNQLGPKLERLHAERRSSVRSTQVQLTF